MSSLMFHLGSNLSTTRQVDGCLTPGNDASKTSGPAQLTMSSNTIDQGANISNDENNPIVESSTSGSVGKRSFSETASSSPAELGTTTIPSPPLSPYTRALTFDESDTRFAQLLFPKATPAARIDVSSIESSEEEQKEEKDDVETDTSVSDASASAPTSDGKKRCFPVEDLKDTSLYINPYGDLKTPGFKKRQLRFLSQYQLVNVAPSVSSYNSISRKNYASSSVSAMNYRYRTAPRTREFVSSDTETDRPRTRRLVRENSVALESDDAGISRPLTPKKRKPAARRVDSPSSSSAPPYTFDYNAIPDYSPPISALPNNSRYLKTEWKGQAMDLSQDPLVGELHPAEVQLASTLRLPANVYLDSKRRIFHEKVKRLKSGLPFRRTDAQKACKIDVNKASRLYASYEKIGWLEDHNFTKFVKK